MWCLESHRAKAIALPLFFTEKQVSSAVHPVEHLHLLTYTHTHVDMCDMKEHCVKVGWVLHFYLYVGSRIEFIRLGGKCLTSWTILLAQH